MRFRVFGFVASARCRSIGTLQKKVHPLDKAGAYAAQGRGAEIIAKIVGSFSNVVGLPMEKTVVALAQFGIRSKST